MQEIHFGPKDFKVEWFSGTGKGGQNRNKRQNCCRITHIATGLVAQGTAARDRVANQKAAFSVLAARILARYEDDAPERRETTPPIRNYHAVRNEVHDKASGLKMLYTDVVGGRGFVDMVAARASAVRLSKIKKET